MPNNQSQRLNILLQKPVRQCHITSSVQRTVNYFLALTSKFVTIPA